MLDLEMFMEEADNRMSEQPRLPPDLASMREPLQIVNTPEDLIPTWSDSMVVDPK